MFTFQDIWTFIMSRDIFSLIDSYCKHVDIIKSWDDKALGRSHRINSKQN